MTGRGRTWRSPRRKIPTNEPSGWPASSWPIIYYNQDKIAQGIREDRLFDLLAKDLAEGRKYYETQVDSEVNKTTPYFDWALVDQLVKTKGSGTQSKIW